VGVRFGGVPAWRNLRCSAPRARWAVERGRFSCFPPCCCERDGGDGNHCCIIITGAIGQPRVAGLLGFGIAVSVALRCGELTLQGQSRTCKRRELGFTAFFNIAIMLSLLVFVFEHPATRSI